MNEIVFIVEDDLEGGFTAKAQYRELSIFTEADTIRDLKNNIMDALDCHFDTEAEIPKAVVLENQASWL